MHAFEMMEIFNNICLFVIFLAFACMGFCDLITNGIFGMKKLLKSRRDKHYGKYNRPSK